MFGSEILLFIARAFLFYLFITNNPWLTKPGEKPPAINWFSNQFYKGDVIDAREISASCVDPADADFKDQIPMTTIEEQITANETCHAIAKQDHRIVNGQPVGIGSRLFQVALFRRGRFACGGSFVSRRFVLTAGHCVVGYKPQELKIRYATRLYELGPTMAIHSVFINPGYNATTVENDLALLRLAYPLPKIPLLVDRVEPARNASIVLAANQTVVVSGWGRTGRALPVSKRLLMATLTTVDKKECQQKWTPLFNVHEKSMLCASDNDKSACNGDSGGPLTLGDKLVGIVSVGSSTCLSIQRPNVYTNVAYFYDWIQQIITSDY